MTVALDKNRFGPWALVTGASSGIGKEFARQIATAGINVVLVARREAVLQEVARSIAADFGVHCRALAMDLSQEDFLARLAGATNDLDIGLVVSKSIANITPIVSHGPFRLGLIPAWHSADNAPRIVRRSCQSRWA